MYRQHLSLNHSSVAEHFLTPPAANLYLIESLRCKDFLTPPAAHAEAVQLWSAEQPAVYCLNHSSFVMPGIYSRLFPIKSLRCKTVSTTPLPQSQRRCRALPDPAGRTCRGSAAVERGATRGVLPHLGAG